MTDGSSNGRRPIFGNQAYDVWKFIAQIALPALGTLYFAVAKLWDLPAVESVVGTITAVDVFLGVLLSYSSFVYTRSDTPGGTGRGISTAADSEGPYDGTFVINTVDPMKDTYSMEFDTPLQDLTERTSVTLRVHSTTTVAE